MGGGPRLRPPAPRVYVYDLPARFGAAYGGVEIDRPLPELLQELTRP